MQNAECLKLQSNCAEIEIQKNDGEPEKVASDEKVYFAMIQYGGQSVIFDKLVLSRNITFVLMEHYRYATASCQNYIQPVDYLLSMLCIEGAVPVV